MRKQTVNQRILIIVSLFLSSFIAGCSDPAVNSLDDENLSQYYDKAYWQAEKNKNSKVWKHALVFCNQTMENAIKPNCQIIADLTDANQWISHAPKVPHYGSGHGFGADDFKGVKSAPAHTNKP